MTTGTDAALTTTEAARLEELEGIIDGGRKTFEKVGQALAEIQKARLYRVSHATFKDYIVERWGFSADYAYKQIRAAEVASEVEGVSTEAQARALSKAPPEKRREVWEAASKDGPPSASKVAKVVEAASDPEPFDELAELQDDYDELLNEIDVAWRRTRHTMNNSPSGNHLHSNSQAVKLQFDRFRQVVANGRPDGWCPACKLVGKTDEDCNLCQGHGWYPRAVRGVAEDYRNGKANG